MRTTSQTQPVSLLTYVMLRDRWNADTPLQLGELAELLGVSRTTIERRLDGVRAINAVGRSLRPRRGARFLPSVVAPYLWDGQPYRRLGPAEGESLDALTKEAS